MFFCIYLNSLTLFFDTNAWIKLKMSFVIGARVDLGQINHVE